MLHNGYCLRFGNKPWGCKPGDAPHYPMANYGTNFGNMADLIKATFVTYCKGSVYIGCFFRFEAKGIHSLTPWWFVYQITNETECLNGSKRCIYLDTVLAYIRHPFIEYSYHIKLKWNDFVANYDKHMMCRVKLRLKAPVISLSAKFMGPTWGPPGSCRPQMGPMLAPWTLLSGIFISTATPQ